MKKLLLSSILLLTVIAFLIEENIQAQNGNEHILKSFPNWITNFDKTKIDLKELRSGGPPKDGIPAIMNPKFVDPHEADDWLADIEPVIALEINGEAKAYPLQILIWHEIVNDKLSDTLVTVTFCPLCYSALVFNRRTKGMENMFGVSGLLRNSDMVMYDQITESFWQQFTGEAIVGEMLGEQLELIPSQIISFQQFKNNYPNGKVLSNETGFKREYGLNPYIGYDHIDQTPFMFDGPDDDRLKPNEKVIAVKLPEVSIAYPYSITEDKNVINDDPGSYKIAVFHSSGAVSALDERIIEDSKATGSTGVFNRIIDNDTLNFSYSEGWFFDDKTNSKWTITGKAIEGKYKGKKLERIPHGDYFAFAWLVFRPETKIYNHLIRER
ncbi:MAG: DUF3179 domain-containing protein [Ignavibacteriae bacterium]|nr:DUF3179 domain-containing protein [Ignavibacteriota bacterium]NOH00295.1 DUF3179 domain-containing protein [Ignavibacteriota bacterium]